MDEKKVRELADRIKAEIEADFESGDVPRDQVNCFSDLHDWTDANMYGYCDEETDAEFIAVLNAAQHLVNNELFDGKTLDDEHI